MRTTVVLLVVVSFLACSGLRDEAIPFVGCPSDGQAGPLPAPTGKPQPSPLADIPAEGIAYYKSNDVGVFAPRGWYCREWYGASGSTLLITPAPLDVTFPPSKTRGYAVERSFYFGGTSGRFTVARYASRLFPGMVTKFVEGVESEGLDGGGGDGSRDSVTTVSTLVVEFSTPANATGLGTEYLEPSAEMIRGAVFLDQTQPAEPNVSIVRIRLGAAMRQFESALLRVNEHCMQVGC
jgi:hypothetical protein